MANGFGAEDELARLRRELGLPAAVQEEEGLWDTVFQPVKGIIGATGNVGGQLAGLLNPEAYEAAAEDLQTTLGVTPSSSVFERGEALPGLGDVAAEMLPESLTESTLGQVTGPVARMIANALGDPTTYTPYILGKLGMGALKGIPAYQRAARAQSSFVGPRTMQQSATAAKELQTAIATGSKMQKAGAWMGQHAMPIDRAMMVGALAYAPELAEGVAQTAGESWRLMKEEQYGEAAKVGASGMLLTGLAGLIGKGAFDVRQADAMLDAAIRKQNPAVADAKAAVDRGDLPIEVSPDVIDAVPAARQFSREQLSPEMQAMLDEAQGVKAPGDSGDGFGRGAPVEVPGPGDPADLAQGALRAGVTERGEGLTREPTAYHGPRSTQTTQRKPTEVTEPAAPTPSAPETGGLVDQAPTAPAVPLPERAADPTQQILQRQQELLQAREALLSSRTRNRPATMAALRQIEGELASLPDVRPERPDTGKVGEPEPTRFDEGLTAEPPGAVSTRAGEATPGKARKATTAELESPTSSTRDPIGHLNEAEAEALRKGEPLAEVAPLEPEGLRTGIQKAIDELTIRHGASPERHAFALKTMGDELGRLRNVTRLRKALERPDLQQNVREVSEASQFLAENRARAEELRKEGDTRPLTDEENALRTQVKASQKVLQDSPLALEVLEAGGGRRADPEEAVSFVKSAVEAMEKGDTEALSKHLADVVNTRMAKARDTDVDPRVEEALGKVSRRVTGDQIPEGRVEGNADAVRQMWADISKGKKYGYAGDELTIDEIFKRFLDEGTEEEAAVKLTNFMEKIVRQGGRSAEKDRLRKTVTVEERKIEDVISEADEADLRYRDEKIDRQDLQSYAKAREAGQKDAQIAEGLGVEPKELEGLNALYNTMKAKTRRKIRREEALPETEEGAVIEAPKDESATLKEKTEDTYSLIEKKVGKSIEEMVDTAPDADFLYGKEKRKVPRDDLKKYVEGRREGLSGKALGEWIWGKDSANKRTRLKAVHDQVFDLKDRNAQLLDEMNVSAEVFWDKFLNTKKVSDLDIDDDFTTAMARMRKAASDADDAQLIGKGKAKGLASPVWKKLRDWAGIPPERNPGKLAIIEGVERRLQSQLPGEAQQKLKRAALPEARADLAEVTAATKLTNRMGLLAGSEVVERARGKKLPRHQRDLPGLTRPRYVKNPPMGYESGTYSAYDAAGGQKVYFTAGENAGGETLTILKTTGEGGLDSLLREARARGTKTIEIPDEIFDGLTPELQAMRRDGLIGRPATRTENARSRRYQVEEGPPPTAAAGTDAAAKAAATRQWYDFLKNQVEDRGWVGSLSTLAARALGRGKGYQDLLKRIAVDVMQGRNMFSRDMPIHPNDTVGPLRQLFSSQYLMGGTKVFDDFEGVKGALREVQRQYGIDPETKPVYLTHGAFNGVFAIGTGRDGKARVMKINTSPKLQIIEDSVSGTKGFMLPVQRAGTTKEGWTWRIEQRGVPMVLERPGVLIPTDLPAAVQAKYVRHLQTIRRLEDEGRIKVLDDKPAQWVMVDGEPKLADRGAIAPARARGRYGDWLAQHEAVTRHEDQLTPRQRDARDTQYAEAIDNPTDGAVNFDGVHTDTFQKRLGAATAGMDSELGSVLSKIQGMARRVEGGEGITVSFGGVTASPYLRGLYAEGKVYANPMEVVYRHIDDPRTAAEELVGTLIHETLHDAIIRHTEGFTSMVDQTRFLAEVDGQFGKWVDQVEADIRKRTSAFDELMPEYREAAYNAASFGRESWRGEASLRKAAVHSPEGGPARAADQRLEGAADLEARAGPRLQPGVDVQAGVRRTPGPLGEAAADGGLDARQAAEDAEVPARGEGEGRRIAAEETGRGEGVSSEVKAYNILKEMVDARTPVPTVMSRSVELAHQLARRIGQTEEGKTRLAELARAKPARGDWWSRYNLDQVDGVSDEGRAVVQLWSQITKGIPELSHAFKADTPRGWDELDGEVKKLLDVKSKTDLYGMLGKGRRGLSDREVVLAKVLGADLITQVEKTGAELAEAQLKLAEGKGTIEEVNAANARHQTAAAYFAEGMPKIINPLTETARALAAARKRARAQNPEAALLQDFRAGLYERLRTKYKDDADARRVTDDLMTLWAEVRNGSKEASEWVDMYRSSLRVGKFDKFLEAYKAFLLGWKSRVANIGSNTLVQGVREIERAVGIGLEKAQAKLAGRESDRYWGELKLNSMIMKHWGNTALPEWWTSFKDGLALRPEEMTLDKMGTLMEDLSHQAGAIEGKTGEFVRFMFKGMNAEDALFKRASQLQHYYKTVYRNIRKGKEGYGLRPGEDIYAGTARYVNEIEETWLKKIRGKAADPAKLRKYGEIHDEGFRIAREETFQTDLPEAMKAFQNALRKPGGKPFQMIFPFVRTPYNIAKETVRRTPAGFYEVAKNWNKVSPAERMDLLARPLVGTGVGLWLMNEAMQGNITGGGPIDPVDEANLRETGWRAYSIRAGNQYLGYQRLEPMSSIIGMAADIAEGVKRGDFTTPERGMTRLFSLVTENLTNKTFLSGLEGLSTAMADPQRSAGMWVKQMQMSIVPNTIGPIPFGHLAQAVDPVYRQTEPMSTEVFASKVPFLSKTLAPQYTPTGELRKRPGTAAERLISPIVRTEGRTDPTAVAATLLDQIGSPPTPPKKYTMVRGIKVYYTPEQRRMLAEAQSRATQIIGTRLVRDPGFMRLPDNEDVAPLGAKTKKQVVKSLYDKYRRSVTARLQPDLLQKAKGHKGGEWRP